MSDASSHQKKIEDMPIFASENLENAVVSFHIPALNVRGRFIRLGAVITEIIEQHGYPLPVSKLLGNASLLGGLLGTSLKFTSRFTMQLQGDGPISLMVSDFQTPGGIRACAKFSHIDESEALDQTQLVGSGQLVFTIDQGEHMNRYQGVVPLEGENLASAAEGYFQQSEQLPTSIHLETLEQNLGSTSQWVGGGLILQHLPAAGEAIVKDLPSGKEEDHIDAEEDDNWVTAKTLAATIKADELTDPNVSPITVLYRLFNEFDIEISEPLPMSRFCQCSEEKCLSLLKQFSNEELSDMLKDDKIDMTCEFCSKSFFFGLNDEGAFTL